MTLLQETYLNKLHATALANIEFFRKNMPDLHRLVVSENPKPTLDISDQGDLSIRYPDGSSLPLTPAILEIEKHLAEFADMDKRPQLLAFHALRHVLDDPSHGDMQRYHYSNFDAEYPNRLRRHFVEHYPDNARLHRYPDFGGKFIPLLIVLGSGIGGHLERLLLEYEVHHLIVIDTDPDSFRLSTFFQDYVLLSRLAMEKGTTLSFIVQPEIDLIARHLMGILRRNLPPFFVHGAALFEAMGDVDARETIKASIIDTLWQLFFGLGYFDDELISIKHTFENLKRRIPIYARPNVVGEDAVAFVIGSGPSLDGLLPILREYGDRAVLFSCGTSLGALAHAGVCPDFHFEKERPHIVYEVLTKTVEADFLRRIRFIGLNVVHPEVFRLFGGAGMALKEADTMGLLLSDADGVERIPLDTQPTVTNMALSIVTSLGFRQVYLVGVDLGFKDTERHHSQHTAYINKLPEAEHLRRLLSKRQASNRLVPGNFGGEVSTTQILDMSRQHMESIIEMAPGAHVHNLNDGALIKGSRPLDPGAFVCLATPAAKAAAISAVRAAFVPMSFPTEDLARALRRQVDAFIDDIVAILETPQENKRDVVEKIRRLFLYIYSDGLKNSPVFVLFRGTILHMASLAYNALSIIADEGEAVAKAEYDLDALVDFMAEARARIEHAPTETLPDITR